MLRRAFQFSVLLVALMFGVPAWAVQEQAPAEFDPAVHQKVVQAGIQFLLQSQDREDGSFSKKLGPAVSAMCAFALMSNEVPAEHPQVQKSLAYVKGFVQPDGGIYASESAVKNYRSSDEDLSTLMDMIGRWVKERNQTPRPQSSTDHSYEDMLNIMTSYFERSHTPSNIYL